MKTILLFGAGKSASVLIEYLLKECEENGWKFIIADADKAQILSKTNNSRFAEAVETDIKNDILRAKLIQRAHIVISMMPPALHFLVAKDCVEYRKHLLTASYLDSQIKSLQDEINHRKLLFLCEMGLDPGIDHMSAMQLFDEIKASGGVVKSFKSHCGGLVAPESDDNPWHYKISWNPRNVVLAGKAGAIYKLDGQTVEKKYEDLFDAEDTVSTGSNEVPTLGFYPNRDSLPYIDLYKLKEADTFIRTTLRYTDFMHGWKKVVDLKLTDERQQIETDGRTLQDIFREHLERNGFSASLDEVLNYQAGKSEATAFEKDELLIRQLAFLGFADNKTMVNKGDCAIADVLQLALETKLALQPKDKDMVVMLHEIEYEIGQQRKSIHSSLVVKGVDNIHTAMAKTVGLPLGITAKLMLTGQLNMTGLHIPISKQIYEPVLAELEKHGVAFTETREDK